MANENEPGSNPTGEQSESNPAGQQPDIGAMVNAAVKSHLSRFAKNELPAMFGEALKPFTEQFAKLQQQAPAETPAKEAKISPEVAALTRTIEELKKANETERNERVATEKRAASDRAFADFKSQLAKGVRPDMLDIVARDMFHNQKLVNINEDGSVTFKGTKTAYGMTEDVDYPLGPGVDSWLKSEAAKPFLPAPAVSTAAPVGSQRRTNGVPAQFGKDADPSKMNAHQKAAFAEEKEAELRALLAARNISLD